MKIATTETALLEIKGIIAKPSNTHPKWNVYFYLHNIYAIAQFYGFYSGLPENSNAPRFDYFIVHDYILQFSVHISQMTIRHLNMNTVKV